MQFHCYSENEHYFHTLLLHTKLYIMKDVHFKVNYNQNVPNLGTEGTLVNKDMTIGHPVKLNIN